MAISVILVFGPVEICHLILHPELPHPNSYLDSGIGA